jgi:hypothetical protein
VYADADPALYEVAERSLLAHLEKLEDEGRVVRRGERWDSGDTGKRQDD